MRLLLLLSLLLMPGLAPGAPLILNEYNAVGPLKYLNGGGASQDQDGNTGAALPVDTHFGRVMGNGGDWLELVVIADHLDIRGWRLEICDGGVCNDTLSFTSHGLWSDLRAGTLITVAESEPEDVSYDPNSGDWWINVRAANTGTGTYITADNFPASNDLWEVTIYDDASQLVYGPAGEAYVPGIGVSSTEILKLEWAPDALTRPETAGYDDGVWSSFGWPNVYSAGLGVQQISALRLGLPFPDRDGDGIPDDGDRSGWAGDAPCTSGSTLSCDDNCGQEPNADQHDSGGVGGGGGDGIGTVCQCGDADNDGAVTVADIAEARDYLAGKIAAPAAPEKCGTVGQGQCDIGAVAVVSRSLVPLPPGIAQVCPAAAAPGDQSDLLYDPNSVLEIALTLDPNDWDRLRFEERGIMATLGPGCMDGPPVSPYNYYPATVTIDGQPLSGVGVRKKGFFGSNDYVKPSLKIDFGEFNAGQQLHDVDRLTLNNEKQDPALVRQCLGYELFEQAGVPAPRCNFAHVTVNGADLGVFANVEPLRTPFLARHFADPDGTLYEGQFSDFRPIWVQTFEHKTGPADPNRADLAAVVTALEQPDAGLLAALDPIVDVDAFLTFWAMEGLIGHWDGYTDDRNNFWVYFDPTSGKMVFIPWGADAILGNGSPFTGEAGMPAPAVRPRSMLSRRLYLHPTTRPQFDARLLGLLDTVWNEAAIDAELNRMETLLTPYGTEFVAPLAAVRGWVAARRQQVLDELAAAPPWTEVLPAASCFEEVGSVTASFSGSWTTLGDYSFGTAHFDELIYLGSPMTFPIEGIAAGPQTPQQGAIQIIGLDLPPTEFTVLSLMLPNEFFQPGLIPLGGQLTDALVQGQVANPGVFTIIGFLVDGQIGFSQAGTGTGDPVVGTVSGTLAWPTPVTP